MGDSHESLQAEVQEPRALVPSTAALRTRPPQPAAPAAGRGCSEAPKAGGPGAPHLRQAGLPAPLRPCCSQLCGAAVCHFLPLPVRAPAASLLAAEDTIRSCLEQQVFSGSKQLCQPVRDSPARANPPVSLMRKGGLRRAIPGLRSGCGHCPWAGGCSHTQQDPPPNLCTVQHDWRRPLPEKSEACPHHTAS